MTIENKYLLALKKRLRHSAPGLLSYGASLYYRVFEFKEEKAYMKGGLKSDCDEASLILLSSNRAATQFIEDVLRKIYEYDGGKYVALNRYLFFFERKGEVPYLDPVWMEKYMKKSGYFYGQQGPFTNHEVFKGYKKVVMCRDPRDLLVSHFYSFTKAHVPRNKEFIQKIKEAEDMGIQKYVLLDEHISGFRNSLKQAVALKDKEDVFFCKYEDMMEDFPSFQEECQKLINGTVDKELSYKLNALHKKPEVNKIADNTRHRRNGAWGQFKKALEPETIEKLNLEFGDLLTVLDYKIE